VAEAGQRLPDPPLMRGFLLLMPELATAQPRQGAGEAAPWAEMDLAQQPRQLKQAEQLNQHGGVGAHQGVGRAEMTRSAGSRRLQQQPACLRQGSLVLRARTG
jgi:hypothetical protein